MTTEIPYADAPPPGDEFDNVRELQPRAEPTATVRELQVSLQLPASLEAEREVLSAVFVDEQAVMPMLAERLEPAQFYWERHQLIFAAMLDLHRDGAPVDPITLMQQLRDLGTWDRAGAVRGVSELLERAGTTANVGWYIAIVRNKWAHRRLLDLAEQVRRIGYDGIDVDESLADLDRAVKRATKAIDVGQRSVTQIAAVAAQHEEMVEATSAAVESGTTLAVPFGLPSLDKALSGGLWRGEQCVIMGSRGMGKSALSGQLIDTNCAAGRRAIFVTLEMTSEQVISRLISNRCGVAYIRQRSGQMTSGERQRVIEARAFVADWQLDIIEAAGWPMHRIEREVRRIIRDEGTPDVAVLDYVQLVADSGEGSEATIRLASGRWASLAKEFKFASVLLAQPVTASTRHDGTVPIPRPKMADSKGSGAVPDDADRFLVVHKPWWAPTKEGRDEVRQGGDDLLRRAEIAIDKDRAGGNIRVVQCRFNGSSMRFGEGASW